jgi:hypothetical protein
MFFGPAPASMVTGQKIAPGRIHARQIITVHAVADTFTIDLGDDIRTVSRTTTQAVRSIKAQQPRKARLPDPARSPG